MSYIVPKDKPNCFYCPFRDMDDCKLTGKVVTLYANTLSTSGDCPLVEIPTPHGRLIDADKLIEELKECMDVAYGNWEYEMATGYSNSIESVEESPTIIEAEGSEE